MCPSCEGRLWPLEMVMVGKQGISDYGHGSLKQWMACRLCEAYKGMERSVQCVYSFPNASDKGLEGF